jgi:hypothetical protein
VDSRRRPRERAKREHKTDPKRDQGQQIRVAAQTARP